MKMNTSVVIRTNDDEVVTRGILREVLEGGLEKRVDSVETRLESIDLRLGVVETRLESIDLRLGTLEKRFDSLDEQVYTLTYEVREEYPRYIQSMFDDMREEMNSRFEAMNARFDALEEKIDNFISFFGRYIKSNEDDKMEINRRVDVIEAKVFLN
jgi:chaperonin cofactor prefoldin